MTILAAQALNPASFHRLSTPLGSIFDLRAWPAGLGFAHLKTGKPKALVDLDYIFSRETI